MGVRWGLLSTARINDAILAGAALSEDVDVVAVAGRDEARTGAYAREKGIPRAHTGYDALLADPEVDAVYVSLPNGLHVEWSIRALEAGKHVLCEKPMSASVAEVERAFDAADGAERLLMEAFMWRHNPQTTALARLIGEGAIGELRQVHAAFSFMLRRDGDPRLDPALQGGALMDVGCYCVSGARLVAGEPLTVSAQAVTVPPGEEAGVDVRLAAVLRHGGGVLTTLDCALDLPARSRLEVAGSTGTIVLTDPWHAKAPRIEIRRDGADLEVLTPDPADSYRLELENLSAAIRGEAEPLLGRADAVGNARAIAALHASAAAGGAPTPV